MKKFWDADKFTQVALVVVLTLFAVICIFEKCSFNSDGESTTTPRATETITDEITTIEEETRPAYLDMGKFKLTAYCACKKCCGKWADGKTATGTFPVQGRTIAVDEDVIPYGSEVIVNGHTYVAEDCGGAIVGNRIDVYFDNHEEALEFGVQYGQVLLKVGDSE